MVTQLVPDLLILVMQTHPPFTRHVDTASSWLEGTLETTIMGVGLNDSDWGINVIFIHVTIRTIVIINKGGAEDLPLFPFGLEFVIIG
jgi:hypothetical protein